MNKYDVLPIEPNLTLSIKNDTTGRNSNLCNLLRLLNSQQDSLSIAINGSWGTGKTFFIKQCQLMLDNAFTHENENNREVIQARNTLFSPENLTDIQKTHFRTAYYDAWEHDSEEDPIASLIRCLATTDWSTIAKESLGKVAEIGASILKITKGIDLEVLANTLKDKGSDLVNVNNLERLKRRFNNTLAKLALEDGQLIIFIDELDRCKPTYAVKLLERIKHYFNNPNVTFIFAVDLSQLQYTINQYYGSQFNGYQYLDRFFDLVIPLPEPNIDKYFDNTKNILETAQHIRQADPKHTYYYLFCKELIEHFSFSIRQINHFYLRTNSATYNLLDRIFNPQGLVSPAERSGRLIIYEFLLPLMSALNQADIDEYNNFISGNTSEDTLKILSNSKEFTQFYADRFPDKSNIDFAKGVSDIYNAVFNDQEMLQLTISDRCVIETPGRYKKRLIDACSLLSPETKLD